MRNVIWALLLGAFCLSGCKNTELPVYGAVPAFELRSHADVPYTDADLTGRVTVVNFVFTSCASVCPVLSSQMRQVQSRWESRSPHVQFLSISVDPERDTPQVLSEYRGRYSASDRWTFLTGETEAVRGLVMQGFKAAVGEVPTGEPGLMELVHGENFVLLDTKARLRGFYNPADDGLGELEAGIYELLREAGLRPRRSR